ncbi:transposase [Nostoc sp. PCC 7107]|uniref:transposase n=1 Tax=Nostoc sp. PCC 7107 TaxID=317936 RepID=UPI0026469F58|nr:transposase [Nostoc sp. PCC 7107]
MPDILSLLQCLLPQINATTMRQFNQIIQAMLGMSGRVTMLGISRWTGVGGSYRTILRFFGTLIPWARLFWLFFRQYLFLILINAFSFTKNLPSH